MSAEEARFPTDDRVEERLGRWSTFAGMNPDGSEIRDAAEAILDGRDSTTEQLAKQTLQYVWRRQDLPHGTDLKQAEERSKRVLRHVRGGQR